MQNATKQAFLFWLKNRPLSSQRLFQAMHRLGWNILYFDPGGDPFLQRSGLWDFTCGKDAFSFCSNQLRVICIRKDRPEKETVFLLLHEIGHIVLGHKLDAISLEEEQEANSFADRCIRLSHFTWTRVLILPAVTAAAFGLGFAAGVHQRERAMEKQYALPSPVVMVAVTEHGERYHLPDCSYISGNPNLRILPADQAEREGYSPCRQCRPNQIE